ncbi:MAG: OmpA family protein [Bacteroidales bacterium]|nr:OmpA family protein [Bacteroidales bacterium]
MKLSSGLFGFLLIVWMGGSTYWYVCKIKNDCENKETSSTQILSDTQNKTSEDALNELSEKKENIYKNTETVREDIINKTKEKLTAGYIVFDFPKNSVIINNISNDFNEFAENLKLYLIENSTDKIEIIGHTDNIGNSSANYKFGQKRALFIKNKLIETGISDEHFIIKSKGEKEPIDTNDTENGRKKNRRVVIKLRQQ